MWNTYKTKIHPLHVKKKRGMRTCDQLEYRAHSKPVFGEFNALNIFDLIIFTSTVVMHTIYNILRYVNILSHFQMVHNTHSYNTRQENYFKSK